MPRHPKFDWFDKNIDWTKRNTQLAKEIGVSTTAISHWRKKLGKSNRVDWNKFDLLNDNLEDIVKTTGIRLQYAYDKRFRLKKKMGIATTTAKFDWTQADKDLGQLTVTQMTHKYGISRTAVYDRINKLKKAGLYAPDKP